VRTTAQAVLDALGFPDGELSILIVDDADISDLNETYLHRTGPTNVIAFPMREGDFPQISPQMLGDVAISAETARREAGAAGIPFRERFVQLLVHGVLHLFGYDHEGPEAAAAEMDRKTRELMGVVDSG
jgi:probable rRNA maturation factor